MNGEKIFKLVSLAVVSLFFTTVIAAPKKAEKVTDEKSANVILSHINLAAQVNDFNSKKTNNPPEKIQEDSKEE